MKATFSNNCIFCQLSCQSSYFEFVVSKLTPFFAFLQFQKAISTFHTNIFCYFIETQYNCKMRVELRRVWMDCVVFPLANWDISKMLNWWRAIFVGLFPSAIVITISTSKPNQHNRFRTILTPTTHNMYSI